MQLTHFKIYRSELFFGSHSHQRNDRLMWTNHCWCMGKMFAKKSFLLHSSIIQQDIEWHSIAANASHFEGVWEREKHRNPILDISLKEQNASDEALLGCMFEY